MKCQEMYPAEIKAPASVLPISDITYCFGHQHLTTVTNITKPIQIGLLRISNPGFVEEISGTSIRVMSDSNSRVFRF